MWHELLSSSTLWSSQSAFSFFFHFWLRTFNVVCIRCAIYCCQNKWRWIVEVKHFYIARTPSTFRQSKEMMWRTFALLDNQNCFCFCYILWRRFPTRQPGDKNCSWNQVGRHLFLMLAYSIWHNDSIWFRFDICSNSYFWSHRILRSQPSLCAPFRLITGCPLFSPLNRY